MFDLIRANDVDGLRARLTELHRTGGKRRVKEALGELNPEGQSLLHVAVLTNSLTILEILLSAGANINKQDPLNNSALHLAVNQCSIEIIKALVSGDADLKLVNQQHKTALQISEEKQTIEGNPNRENFARIAALLRTRQAWQDATVGFRFNQVVSLISNVSPHLEQARGRDKVLVIGRTGAGKSTLLNYLNGTTYRTGLTRGSAKPFAERIGGAEEIAKTGSGMGSETLYPQVINKQGLDFVYCDLAGLFDNRGDAERICAASSVQVLSRLPGDIKGIVAVLDLPSFLPKGESFRKTAVALAQMVQTNPELMNSVHFVITQISNDARSTLSTEGIIRDYVEGILILLQEREESERLSSEDLALKFMLEQMQRLGAAHIMLSDITDRGESRLEIETKINELPAQEASQFNFISHDGSQESFNFVLETIATDFLTKKQKRDYRLPNAIAEQQQRQRELQGRITALENEIANMQREIDAPYDPSQIDQTIANTQQSITNNEAALIRKRTELTTLGGKKGSCEAELRDLDRNDRILVRNWTEELSGKPREHRISYVSPYALDDINTSNWGWGSHSSTLEKPQATGRTYVDASGVTRTEYRWDEDARNGRYQELFRRSEGISKIVIDVFTLKKHMHVARIDQLCQDISNYTNKINTLSGEITELERQTNTLRTELLNLQTAKIQEEANHNLRIQRLRDTIATRREWLAIARTQLAESQEQQRILESELQNIQLEIEVNADLFHIVYDFTHILDFSEAPEIQQFWQAHEQEYPDYQINHHQQNTEDNMELLDVNVINGYQRNNIFTNIGNRLAAAVQSLTYR